MRALGIRLAVTAALLLVCAAGPRPAAADTSTEVGILATIASATHTGSENPVPISGVGPAGLFEVQQHLDRFRLRFEGIPMVTVSAAGSGPFGTSTASLGYFNATALAAVDANRRISLGYGLQLVNLRNTNGNNGDVNRARVTSSLYALSTDFPVSPSGALETNFNIDPNLRGLLHVFSFDGTFRQDKPEAGAEVDYAADYRWERGNWIYRAGVRGISYHTRDVNVGNLVDRNVGGGITFDVRYRFGK